MCLPQPCTLNLTESEKALSFLLQAVDVLICACYFHQFSHSNYVPHHLFPLIIYQALGETTPTATSTLRRVYLDFSKESLPEMYKSSDPPSL